MPPKPQKAAGGSKKTVEKKKDKTIEDKTFGLKNKKGAKQQRFVQQVEKQVKHGHLSGRQLQELEAQKRGKGKDDKKKEQEELNNLFKPVAKQQVVAKGTDPKSVVCAFFKQGLCQKGAKCKFSHDLLIERKAEKRSAYVDMRDDDTMESWDEKKLEEVVETKHGEKNKTCPKTDIICKYFVAALEENKYGWFWECPNGDKCHYRHALPPGFVLKKDKKRMEEQEERITIEELVESERAKLGANVTKITLDSFLAWKKRKRQEKIDKANKDKEKKKTDYQAGRTVGLSGRDMFTFNPELAQQDDEEATEEHYERTYDESEEDDGIVAVDVDEMNFIPVDVDASGTQATSRRLTSGDTTKLNEAAGGGDTRPQQNGDSAQPVKIDEDLFTDDVPVDEDLFAGEDLDDLEDELDELNIDK